MNNLKPSASPRIDSLDLVRGIVMVLMLLDHARDFFHQYAMVYQPEDLTQTTPIIFFSRWVTNFCAPAFVFLAGISAYLYQQKGRSRKDVQRFLISRGLFLILLEETLISLAWRMSIDLTIIRGLVIWALGWSMLALAGLLFLSPKAILISCLSVLLFHNLLDPVHFDHSILQALWTFLHQEGKVVFLSDPENPASVVFTWRMLYPVLPMIALMGLGYWMGKWYHKDFKADIRQGMLLNTGLILISAFICLRFIQFVMHQYDYHFLLSMEDVVNAGDSNNVWLVKKVKWFCKQSMHYFFMNFGDPAPMVPQNQVMYTFMSFLTVHKYPFSLFFVLVTMGPLLIVLSILEKHKLPERLRSVVKTIGSVPLFYYIAHLFLLRLLASLYILIFHTEKFSEIIRAPISAFSPIISFNIFMVYGVTLLGVALLFPLCRWYANAKKKGNLWIYSYI
ncbi:MAG: heparan-alpha-glucosaminide N-acetyltransferase domain-containing protein [Cytophagaceae bacterium]|jgi:uncharacterized membrane protein|nr:heparan-alpha-glucosaminide N-acetyltransferase domain-containing protein [Cytophagaceae bacterium]